MSTIGSNVKRVQQIMAGLRVFERWRLPIEKPCAINTMFVHIANQSGIVVTLPENVLVTIDYRIFH